MQFKHKIFEALKNTPEGWRFCNCWDKEAKYAGNHFKSPFTLDDVLNQKGNGVGVLLGGHSTTTINGKKYGLGAVDFDGTNSDLSFEHYLGFDPAALTKTVTVASGKKDRKQMFYWIPEEYLDVLKKKEKQYQDYAKFELRIGNHYSMVAGAHPETDGYFWVNSPADTDIAIAPLLLLEGWEELSKDDDKPEEIIVYQRSRDELIYDSSRVPRYLEKFFSPAINYAEPREEWIKIIQALRHLSQEWEDLTGEKDKHLKDADKWCSQMGEYYDRKDLHKTWYSFKRNPTDKNTVTISTFFHKAKQHPNWKDEVRFQGDQKEKPKRKRSELLNDLIKHAKSHNLDDYFEDFAEMEHRFKRSPSDINNDLLNVLRDSYSSKSFKVGEVDMSKVDDLEYILEGFLIRGENHQFYAGAGMGKTSLLAGMIKSGYKGIGFLNHTRRRNKFRTLWIACDGSSSRFKSVYEDMGLNPEMVDVLGGDLKQGLTNWKWNIPNLILLRKILEDQEKNYGLVVFDSVKGMLSGTGFKYIDNEHADSICQFLREIIGEPLGMACVLINHLSNDGKAGSGAKRWGEAVAMNVEIKPVIDPSANDGGQGVGINHNERKLCIWKDPIGGRRLFDYMINRDGIFVPSYKTDTVGDCFQAVKKFLVESNFKTGKSVFTRTEIHAGVSNYSRAHKDRTIKEHLGKLGMLKQQKDSNGKAQRGRFVLKVKFKLNKEITEQEAMDLYKNPTEYIEATNKMWGKKEDMDYWDADPATLPPKKDKKEEKDYSHFFIKGTPEDPLAPHPDRNSIKPEGSTTEMTSGDKIDVFKGAMESNEAKDQIIDL